MQSSCTDTAPDIASADEAAVRKTDADWVKAAKSRKVEDWVAFYSDDAVVLPPNDKTASGKENIRKLIGEMFAVPNVVITWAADENRSGEIRRYRLPLRDLPNDVERRQRQAGYRQRQDGRDLEEAGRRKLEVHCGYVELGSAARSRSTRFELTQAASVAAGP